MLRSSFVRVRQINWKFSSFIHSQSTIMTTKKSSTSESDVPIKTSSDLDPDNLVNEEDYETCKLDYIHGKTSEGKVSLNAPTNSPSPPTADSSPSPASMNSPQTQRRAELSRDQQTSQIFAGETENYSTSTSQSSPSSRRSSNNQSSDHLSQGKFDEFGNKVKSVEKSKVVQEIENQGKKEIPNKDKNERKPGDEVFDKESPWAS